MIDVEKVSVVIPCFNCDSTIERALESVVSQSIIPYEVVMVNDNGGDVSDDVLLSIIEKYSKSLNIIYIRHLINLGAPSARNTGINVATGNFIALLDADDSWASNKLEIQLKFLNDNPHVDVVGHSVILKSELSTEEVLNLKFSSRRVTLLEILLRNPLPTPTLMFKKSKFVGFDENMYCVDDHLLLMNMIASKGIVFKIESPLAFIYKPMFGTAGLSGNLLRMELFELLAYTKFSLANLRFSPLLLFFYSFSILKYLKRVIQALILRR